MITENKTSEPIKTSHSILEKFSNFYFIGIGGIGMSNLARYFLSHNKQVAGYDRTSTTLSQQLEKEGALIHYEDNVNNILPRFKNPETTLMIYTPAVPGSQREFVYFTENNFVFMKRAQVLGEITKLNRAICCAGTHGKTTVSSMIAHALRQSSVDCSAFLGGILKNYQSNLLISDTSDITVIEADEYDRSFHWLHPWIAIITSTDPDHLDVYENTQQYHESFEKFTSLIRNNGYLIIKKGLSITPQCHESVTQYTYSLTEGDFYADNIHYGNGTLVFDLVYPEGILKRINLGVPVLINVENAIAAAAAAWLSGVSPDEFKVALSNYQGAKRRFDLRFKSNEVVFVDDYAHHPNELMASILSIKKLYTGKKITGIFQPHLYSRTRDFLDDFAASLSLLDELILLDIYPAREEPIEGITSQLILDKVTIENKILCSKEELLNVLKDRTPEVLVTLGAGDIESMLPDIEQYCRNI
ncbi:MAG: UDP-N-acetylmuramate--L-alanine ligase [Dysgonamonadaceae bacterium]|nr:UDP-N-acetylmuramate--L-alanine ligase [Dysgonamonadaceae bacterium]MDD4729328.1 UDP-N-acetylmuramate--L-alanine ligase [Dysgonamonadaceae bacterium]